MTIRSVVRHQGFCVVQGECCERTFLIDDHDLAKMEKAVPLAIPGTITVFHKIGGVQKIATFTVEGLCSIDSTEFSDE